MGDLSILADLICLYRQIFTRQAADRTDTIYMIHINGHPDDFDQIDLSRYIEIRQAETDAHKAELEQVLSMLEGRPFSVGVKASTGSLNGTIDDVVAMQLALKNHIRSAHEK